MRCPSCGRDTVEGDRFCQLCGKALTPGGPAGVGGSPSRRSRLWIAGAVVLGVIGLAAMLRYRGGHGGGGLSGFVSGGGSSVKGSSVALANVATVDAPCPQPDNLLSLEYAAIGASGAAHVGQATGGAFGALGNATAGATSTPADAPAKCHALTVAVDSTFKAIEDVLQGVPTDYSDEDARRSELADTGAIFAFVRDTIRTQAYAGAMRGGVGTLMSRAGSPADKDLLLADLLAPKSVPIRFVHSTLSDAEVAQVIAAVLGAPAPRESRPSINLPDSAIQRFTGGANTAQPIADQIIASLTGAGAPFAKTDAQLRGRWAANLRDHWWVQAQENNNWVDLDPTLPTATPGSHLGPAPTDPPVDQLPDSVYTKLTFRIVADYLADKGVTTDTLVDHVRRAAEVYAKPIVVQVSDPDATVGNLAKSTTFTASVTITDGGSTNSGAFQPDSTNGAKLLRLRLEVETDRPGYPPLFARRTLVDRSNESGTGIDRSWDPARTAYALTIRYDGLAQGGELDPAFAAAREVEGARAMHAFLVYAVNHGSFALPQDANATYPLEVMHYFELDGMVRHETEVRSSNHTRFFSDRPAIVFVRRVIQQKGSAVSERHEFDVVDDAMDVTGASAPAAIRDNIVRGVIDDAIEAHVTVPNGAVTTRTVLAAASQSGVRLVAVLPAGSPSKLPASARAAAAASLQRGAIVATSGMVSLAGEKHVGWWEVDPGTGSTIGRLESGAGQALSEYLPTTSVALKAVTIADIVGGFDRCMFDDADAVLTGGAGGDQLEAAAECGKDVACDFAVGQAVGDGGSLFEFENDEVVNQLLDLDNDLWGLSGSLCGGG